ncbi:GntR family transcriptional regulator [Glaciimonas immobilis]|uniref:DNA-binding GntR family transcriptional regulator n=1 Tax=Glaciimonas immobilis TaxID=728004 RepID=A0A840RYV3_9BURK|nr:GntR family transcriptional regulator [Glaciimonas immobilis]KAF3996047.1 GntR family transcriptional regulator [Glaciimonas immobilis]MBB5201824.1 DNA-binding GntR family transcriptional regulator [Glaciimonas immobilis]
MKELTAAPTVVERVYQAIISEISEGKLSPGSRIIQEEIAQGLGVSRQPVQQALLLLRNQGVLQNAPGRGLMVAPMDLDYVQHMYNIRAVVEGLACSLAATKNSVLAAKLGPALIKNGFKAVKSGSVTDMITTDMKFHEFIYRLSENPLIGPAMDTHWVQTHRVMGEVLMRDETPRNIWDQHEEILNAIIKGDATGAERMARKHITMAAKFMINRMRGITKNVENAAPVTEIRAKK